MHKGVPRQFIRVSIRPSPEPSATVAGVYILRARIAPWGQAVIRDFLTSEIFPFP